MFSIMLNRTMHLPLILLLCLWASFQAQAQGLSNESLTGDGERKLPAVDHSFRKLEDPDKIRLKRASDPTERPILDRSKDQPRPETLRGGGTSGTSGGGDRYTNDFAKIAELEIYPWLKIYGSGLTPAVDAEAFRIANDPSAMESVDQVFESCQFILLNEGQQNQHLQAVPQNLPGKPDREREACYNDNAKLIYISRSRYPLTMQNSAPKRGLIAHEIFRKMGIEGNEHGISKQIPILLIPVSGPNGYKYDQNECTSTMQILSSLLSSYVDTLKVCHGLEKSHQTNMALYRTEATIARQIESTFANTVFYCNQVCVDASACNLSSPQGICRK